ncbi:19943_t:CDS:1, partial [Dentiscutata erythropus]
EQPLLLLSFVLHPKYGLSKFSSDVSGLSYSHFSQWLNYYYHAWFDEVPICILHEFLLYQREVFSFNKEMYKQFDENIFDFWDSTKGLAPELS